MAIPPFLTSAGDSCILEVLLQPRSSNDAVVGVQGAALKVRVTAPPVDDRANRALEALVAARLGIPKGRVSVVGGHTSRHKRVRIEGVGTTLAAGLLGVADP